MANFQLLDDQQVSASLVGEDDQGNPAPLPAGVSAVWSSSDDTLATVDSSADPTGATAMVKTTGKLGTVQISVSVTLPGAANPITGSAMIDVVASALSQVAVSFGTPEPRA